MTHDTFRGRARAAAGLVLLALLLPAAARAAAVADRVELANGIRLLVAERRSLPVVAVEVLVDAGSRYEPADKAGLANLMADLLTHGAGSRTGPQIDEAIDFVGASLGSGASGDGASGGEGGDGSACDPTCANRIVP